MERLQWWLLLLSAVMFSMSGCASAREWRGTAFRDLRVWSEHPAHFASAQHMAFSIKPHPKTTNLSDAEANAAAREDWWGRDVVTNKTVIVAADTSVDTASTPIGVAAVAPMSTPSAVSTPAGRASGSAAVLAASEIGDVTGRWRGRWVANGAWGERRESDAEMIFLQSGDRGTSRLVLTDTVAAVGVPESVRHFGALGTPMSFRIVKDQVLARFEDGAAVSVRLTRVGDRLYGRMDRSPSFQLVLDRQ